MSDKKKKDENTEAVVWDAVSSQAHRLACSPAADRR